MALNIKNPRAVALASAVAAEAGETMTTAIIHALEERLLRLQARRDVPSVLDAILEISARCAALPDQDRRTADEILGYDSRGTFG